MDEDILNIFRKNKFPFQAIMYNSSDGHYFKKIDEDSSPQNPILIYEETRFLHNPHYIFNDKTYILRKGEKEKLLKDLNTFLKCGILL